MIPGQTKPSTLIMPSNLRSLKCDRTSPSLLWARTWQKQGRIQFIRTAVRVNPADVVNADRGRSAPPGPMPRGICPTDRQDRSKGRFVKPRPAVWHRSRDRMVTTAGLGRFPALAADRPALRPYPTAEPGVRDRV